MVQLKSAVAMLGGFPALAGVDLRVDSGEVLLIQGPNGAGKTTLLRLCAGLVSLGGGAGEVLGIDLAELSGRRMVRRNVGLMGHSNALYDDLTVRQNVDFWATASGADPAAGLQAMERTGLAGRLSSVRVSALSAGQRRRTAIAILLCRRPKLWLLDEPHAGLDRSGRQLVNSLISDASKSGATVIVASHDQEWAESVSSRSVNVAGGQITQ